MNRKQAVKIAIDCIAKERRRYFAFNANLYKKYKQTQYLPDYERYMQLTEVITFLTQEQMALPYE
jgi:hypothetical protein